MYTTDELIEILTYGEGLDFLEICVCNLQLLLSLYKKYAINIKGINFFYEEYESTDYMVESIFFELFDTEVDAYEGLLDKNEHYIFSKDLEEELGGIFVHMSPNDKVPNFLELVSTAIFCDLSGIGIREKINQLFLSFENNSYEEIITYFFELYRRKHDLYGYL